MVKKAVNKTSKKSVKLGKFEKFDKAEKEIKEAGDAVQDLAKDFGDSEQKKLLTRAALDIERAEAEVEEADEDSF
ncbi:Uncharacterised protein [uncultured archaeon]|nr:Uncharacterised protein [uncultured archaeon]